MVLDWVRWVAAQASGLLWQIVSRSTRHTTRRVFSNTHLNALVLVALGLADRGLAAARSWLISLPQLRRTPEDTDRDLAEDAAQAGLVLLESIEERLDLLQATGAPRTL